MTSGLADAEGDLKQAQDILRHGSPSDGETWLLLATLVGEADLAFQAAKRRNPYLTFPLLDDVVEEFREMTAGFTDPVFLRATGAARRRNRALFG
ncbi:MAG TPA: hypothetical protein VF662_12780 [Allosphingosinicella sp.]